MVEGKETKDVALRKRNKFKVPVITFKNKNVPRGCGLAIGHETDWNQIDK